MWVCPACRRKNRFYSQYCIECGRPKKVRVPVEEKEMFDWRDIFYRIKWRYFLLLIPVCIVGIFIHVERNYQRAESVMQEGNYLLAKKLYNQTIYYRDAEEKIMECEYLEAVRQMELGNRGLVAATKRFVELGDYKDSEKYVEQMIPEIYENGIQKYRERYIADARAYFELTPGYGETEKYITLIDGKLSPYSDLTPLFELLGFEDTGELLVSDMYLETYLQGYWGDEAGNYLHYYKNEEELTNVDFNLPSTTGSYFRLGDGAQYHGNEEGWTMQWSFEVVSGDQMIVHNAINGVDYVLTRQY